MEAIKNTIDKLIHHHSAPKPPAEQTILVTGASGFVAAHVLHSFLHAGYKVRGTVRSDATAQNVLKTHESHASQLSFEIVPDIRTPGAFDEAVKGVDGVIHTASPFVFDVADNERDLLEPAIQGTTGILESVAKHAPQVKRVVVTSSFAAIIDMGKTPEEAATYTYTEEDWNPCTYEEAKAGNGAIAYCASKAFAERCAFDFVKDKHPNFDVATICPPMIYGPVDHAVSDLSKLNTSIADIYRFMNGSTTEIPETGFPLFADVRDVAEAHLRAYERPEAGGQRYAITGGNFFYQQVCLILREEYPELKDKVPDAEGFVAPPAPKLSNEKAKRELGMEFRDLKSSIIDTARSLIELERKMQQ